MISDIFSHRLIFLRHARAESSLGLRDRDRPLSVEGRRVALQVGVSLLGRMLIPDRLLVSVAVRTRQTAELVLKGLGPAGEAADRQVDYVDELYSAGPQEVVTLIRKLPESVRTVLVVGHEPTISAAVISLSEPEREIAGTTEFESLAQAQADADNHGRTLRRLHSGMPTAGYAVLNVPGMWLGVQPGMLALQGVVTDY